MGLNEFNDIGVHRFGFRFLVFRACLPVVLGPFRDLYFGSIVVSARQAGCHIVVAYTGRWILVLNLPTAVNIRLEMRVE